MKKTLLMMLIIVMIFTFACCGGSDNKAATIIDNEGNTVEMTAEELVEIAEGNKAQYEKYYLGASIDVTGKVSKIETKTGFDKYNDLVYLDDSWVIRTVTGTHDWADVAVGTKIRVKSNISYYGDAFVGRETIMIEGCTVEEDGSWHSDADLDAQTVIEIIE